MNDTTNTSSPTAPAPRRVSLLLGIGIFAMPYVFAWFTLRKGYPSAVRALSLCYLGLWALVYVQMHTPRDYQEPRRSSSQATHEEAAPSRKVKRGVTKENFDAIQVGWTKQQVTDLLGKPFTTNQIEGGGVSHEVLSFRTFAIVGIKAPKIITVSMSSGVVAGKEWAE